MELTDNEIKAIKKLQGTGTLEEEWLKRPMYPSEWKLIFDELPKECKVLEQQPCEDCISRQAVIDDLEKSHITSGVHNQGTWNECVDSIIRTISYQPSVTPHSKIVETGWGELFLLDGMSKFIKKEMDELLKSPWAQDKTFTPHDMAIKEAFATVKDLILSKFEIKEGWENLIHGQENSE